MSSFEKIAPAEFCRLVAERGSAALRRQFARFMVAAPARWQVNDCLVHRGPVSLTGRFKAPAHQTLILGDLFVEGLVDLEDTYDEGACSSCSVTSSATSSPTPTANARSSTAT